MLSSFLTISFNNTIAVVANISKQLSVTRGEEQGEKRLMSYKNMQHRRALAVFIMAHITCCIQKTCKQAQATEAFCKSPWKQVLHWKEILNKKL